MSVIKYIELKTGFHDNGPAWIGHVRESKSRRTLYFNGMALRRASGLVAGNYFDTRTGDEYWVSGVKKRGTNRHLCGSGKIVVEAAAVDALAAVLGTPELDGSLFTVSHSIRPTDPANFVQHENQKFE